MIKINKIIKTLSISAIALLLASCNNFSTPDLDKSGYGSLTINSSERYIDTSTISSVKASIKGYGMETLNTTSTCSNGKGILSFEKVPVGTNRIITIEAYSTSKITGCVIKALCDIHAGSNTCNISWGTTALADVVDKLNDSIIDISNVDVSSIKAVIESGVHSALINTSSIAEDYLSGNLKTSSSYVLKGSTLTVTNYDSDSYTVQVGDPVSKVASSSGKTCTVTDIAPGTWPVYILSGSSLVSTQYESFSSDSDKTLTIGHENPYKEKICIHGYGYKYIWTWDDGAQGKLSELTQDGSSDWYSIVLDTTSTNFILRPNGGDNWGGKTEDLKAESGEYWVKDGKVYTSNPDDSEKPVLIDVSCNETGVLSGTVNISVSASDNVTLSKVIVSVDGSAVVNKAISGKSFSGVVSLDTTELTNGDHVVSVVVMDASGLISDAKTISITTKNDNVPPVAVISGSSTVTLGATAEYASSSYDKNGTIQAYSWSVSGGAKITSGNGTSTITVSFPSSETTCSVSLKVQDNEGAWSNEETTTVNVREIQASTGDFREESIYFLLPTRFYDGDSSNNVHTSGENGSTEASDPSWRGDYKGLIEKLDYIKALGFSAIWITPVVQNNSALDYHGYHASNFTKVDDRYASDGKSGDDMYQLLIDEAHKKGIKIVQDVVFNHSCNWGEDNLLKITNSQFSGGRSDLVCKGSDGITTDSENIYHHNGFCGGADWDEYSAQNKTIADDCFDFETENPKVYNYLIDCYKKYIGMGVDAFRVDTVKHISRLTLNSTFVPELVSYASSKGNDNFYMFGEVCTKGHDIWYRGNPPISTCFYTWKETGSWANCWTNDLAANEKLVESHYQALKDTGSQPTSKNAFLEGNTYHTPDYSLRSRMDVIDFQMHWSFLNANKAFNTARGEDAYFNDSTWNVVYVDSHDYGPDEFQTMRYNGGTDAWAENMSLMWTFRGIPCIYYGSEVEFMKGSPIDKGGTMPLSQQGRAYYGDYLEGSVSASDYSEYTASGTVKSTLEMPLSQHLMDLNRIRRAIPALQKGQYSCDGCSGNIAFKRRYTGNGRDSFVLVTISGDATFTGIPGGTYVDVVTGDKQTVSEGGTLKTSGCSGSGNMRVYVNTTLDSSVTGKLCKTSSYLK